MKIISKFHDYYDVVMRQGQDKSIVYNREVREIPLPYGSGALQNPVHQNLRKIWRGRPEVYYSGLPLYGVDCCMVGFCGRWYACFNVSYSVQQKWESKRVEKLLYTPDECIEYIQSVHKKPNNRGELYSQIKTFFKEVQAMPPDIFLEENSPIVVVTEVLHRSYPAAIIVNAQLKPYNFVTVKDPYQAFQDIAMYVSGVLKAPEKTTLDISDNCMRDKKGFDKWSFRKQKEGFK
jgi:hypothetical protein